MVALSRQHYTADACIIWCFDNRFWPAFLEFIKDQGYKNFDPVFCAGGAKNLGDPADPNDRDFVLKQIGLSIKLHHAKKLVLMTHEDCGAFGGSKAFGGDQAKEFEKHEQVHSVAKEVIQERFPDINVSGYFISFDGLRST